MVSGDIGRTAYTHAGIREPEQIPANPVLTDILDLTKPVGLMLVAVLISVGDQDDPRGMAGTPMDAVPSGSHMAISRHGHEFNPEAVAGNAAVLTLL